MNDSIFPGILQVVIAIFRTASPVRSGEPHELHEVFAPIFSDVPLELSKRRRRRLNGDDALTKNFRKKNRMIAVVRANIEQPHSRHRVTEEESEQIFFVKLAGVNPASLNVIVSILDDE
jgi:hypothetical protein